MEAESDNQTPGSSSTPSVPTPSVPTPSVVAALPTPPPPGKDRQQHGKGYDEEKPCGQFQQKTADCTCESHSTNTYNDFEIIVDSRPTEGQAPVPKKNQFTKRPEVSKLDRVLNDLEEAHEFIAACPQGTTLFDSLDALWGVIPLPWRMARILPARETCDNLINLYFAASDRLYRTILARPFMEEYNRYWDRKDTHDSFLPRLLCILCTAAQLDQDLHDLGRNEPATIHIPTALSLATEWVKKRLKTDPSDIWTLQGRLLVSLAIMDFQTRQSLKWTDLGTLVRMGMEIGLHQGLTQGAVTSAAEKECRRRLWFTIMDQDIQTSMQRKLPCAFRLELVGCASPSNLDDDEINPNVEDVPISRPLDEITENHLQAYAWSTLKIRTQASELLARSRTLGCPDEVLKIGRELEGKLNDISKFFPPIPGPPQFGPDSSYRKWYHCVRLDLHVRLSLLVLYEPFALGYHNCPEEIQRAYLTSCLAVLTYLKDAHSAGAPTIPRKELSVLYEAVADAAYGVCYFVKQARGPDEHGEENRPEILGCKVGDMLQIVDVVLEKWLGFVKLTDSRHFGDLIAVSIMWEMLQTGTPDDKVGKMQMRLDRILAFCSRRVPWGKLRFSSASAGSGSASQTAASVSQVQSRGAKAPASGSQVQSRGSKAPELPPKATWGDLSRYWDRLTRRKV